MRELPFVHDQVMKVGSSSGKLLLVGNDMKEKKRQDKMIARYEKEQEFTRERHKKVKEMEARDREALLKFEEEDSDENVDSVENAMDEDFKHKSTDDSLRPKQHNTLKLTNTAHESIRFDVSVRATAAIASGALVDVGFVTAENAVNLVDMKKVDRERTRLMEVICSKCFTKL